jgi:hypothetical protein
MRLFEGWGGGDDGPGGSDTRDENTSDYSPSGSGEGGGDPSSSQAVEGDYGFAVFSAIDKVESGQPLSSRDVAVLEGAGLGGMVSDGGDPTRSALYSNYGYGAGLSGGATETFDRILSATGDTNRAFAAMGALQEAEKGNGTFNGGWVYRPNGTATSLATGLTFWQQHLKTIPGVQVINGVQTTIANRAGKQPIASDIAVAYQREAEAARVAKEAREQEEARQAEIARQAEARRQEEARIAEEARRAEEARIAEQNRLAEIAYQEQVARELAAAQAREQERIAEEARQVEVQRQEAARQAEEARVAEQNRQAEIAYQEQAARDLAAAQNAISDEGGATSFPPVVPTGPSSRSTSIFGGRSSFGRASQRGYFAPTPPAPVAAPEVAALPEDVEAKSNLDRLEEELQDAMAVARLQTYYQTLDRGGSRQEADAAADKAANDIYFASRGLGSDSSGLREESDPGYIGGPLDQLGDVSGLEVEQNPFDTGRGVVFEDVTQPSGGGIATVDTGVEEPLGPPPEGFTGPVFEGQLGLSAGDIAYKNLGDLADTPALEPSGWTPDTAPPAPDTGGLGSVVGRLREGDISGALSLLRDTISTPATPAVDEQPFVGPDLPSNFVGTGSPGGYWTDSYGNPILSTSYGRGDEYVSSGPTLDPALLESAATARKMTVEELRAVIDAEIQGGSPVGTTGLSRETLEALQEKGFGGRDIGLEPGTQTVDQALASMQTNQFLTDYLPTIIGMVGPPGTGALLSGVRTISDLMQGKLSPGAAMTRELIGLLARQANIPASVLTNILEGKFGDAAANQAKSFMFNTLAQEAGVEGSAIGMIADELGFLNPLTGQIDKAVTEVIPDQNFGIPGRVAAGLDEFVGPIQGAVSQGLGALGDAAQTGLTGLGNVLGQIGQGVQTGVGAITGGIGDLVNTITNAVTGGGTAPVVDESGVGGVDDPSQFEFRENRDYAPGTTGYDEYEESLGFTPVVDETGPGGADVTEERTEDYFGAGSTGVIGEELGEGVPSGVDEWDQSLIRADTDGIYDSSMTTGSVGLPGEELGEGILTGVDPWDQALIDADTGGVYDLDTGTGADTVTNVGGVGTDAGGGDTDTVVQPPPPVIPPSGGGTAQPYGSYFARVPTGYQVVQGLYGPIMQYTYGNLPLGGT